MRVSKCALLIVLIVDRDRGNLEFIFPIKIWFRSVNEGIQINMWIYCRQMRKKIRRWRRTIVKLKRQSENFTWNKNLIVGTSSKLLNTRHKLVSGYPRRCAGKDRKTRKLLTCTMGPHPHSNTDRLSAYLSGNDNGRGLLAVIDKSQVRTRERL